MDETVCTLIQLLLLCEKNQNASSVCATTNLNTKSLLCWADWKNAGALVHVNRVPLDSKCIKTYFRSRTFATGGGHLLKMRFMPGEFNVYCANIRSNQLQSHNLKSKGGFDVDFNEDRIS